MCLGELAVIIIRGMLKMALLAQSAPAPPRSTAWFREFLKVELTPSPERVALVARMVIAATIVMIITMTFRMPYGAYASLYALTISRESPQTTGKAVKSIVAAFVLGGAYVLISACFFRRSTAAFALGDRVVVPVVLCD
jgi:multidrug resistance protein MdtO